MTQSIAVIGAGVAGLSAAAVLARAGLSVTVIEKSRGPGGRMATRRQAGLNFDHGAQYFTARDPAFCAEVRAWVAAGCADEWRGRIVALEPDGRRRPVRNGDADGARRYIGTPGMSAPVRWMARQVDVRYETPATAILVADGHVVVETGSRERFDAAIVTCPPAQAAALLPAGSALVQPLEAVRMRPCWAVLTSFDADLTPDFDAAFVGSGPLSWISRNSTRPGRAGASAWVLHAGPDWSEAHLDAAPDAVIVALLDAFFEATRVARKEVSFATAHRWRYALADPPLTLGCFVDSDARIAVAGDWTHGSRVEGAWLAGRSAAGAVIDACRAAQGP